MSDEAKEDVLTENLSIGDRRKQFGASVRRLRETKGLSIKDLVHLTRISPPFVRALEDGYFEGLPGQVFGRGFMKNICKALEVDATTFLQDYDECWNIDSQRAITPKKRFRASRLINYTNRPFRKFKLFKIFSMLGLLRWVFLPISAILLVLLSWYQIKNLRLPPSLVKQEKSEEPSADSDNNFTTKPQLDSLDNELTDSVYQIKSSESQIVSSEQEQKDIEIPISTENAQLSAASPSEQALTGEGVLTLNVKESVGIKSRLDNQRYVEKVYDPGNYVFSFKNKADFYIYNTDVVDITFNKQKLKNLGVHGKERKLSFIVGKLNPANQ